MGYCRRATLLRFFCLSVCVSVRSFSVGCVRRILENVCSSRWLVALSGRRRVKTVVASLSIVYGVRRPERLARCEGWVTGRGREVKTAFRAL